jgi:hypothetical protein
MLVSATLPRVIAVCEMRVDTLATVRFSSLQSIAAKAEGSTGPRPDSDEQPASRKSAAMQPVGRDGAFDAIPAL